MAKATRRIKSAAVAFPVPQSREDVIDAIARLGEAQRERERISADMNDALAAVREQYEARAKPLAEQIDALKAGVQTWCEAHRDELTQTGKVKTHAFASGEVKWRIRPPAVRITVAAVPASSGQALSASSSP